MRILGLEFSRASEIAELRETLADMERRLEDVGWIKIQGGESGLISLARESYDKMVKRCRLAFIKNPLVGQAVNITTNYTFGEGISKPRAKDERVQEVVDAFWDARDNKISCTSPQVQIKLSNKIQYDGEIVFLLQPDVDGALYVRVVDPLTISDIKTDKDDEMRPLFYKRTVGGLSRWYADWENGAAVLGGGAEVRDSAAAASYKEQLKELSISERDVARGSYIYHVKVNNDVLDRRGVPMVFRAIDWVNSVSGIAGDMSTFIRSQAQYAWQKKVKGTRAQIDAIKARIKQNSTLTNPAYQAGSTLIENDLITNAPVALPNSSGQLFEIGIRRPLLMVCAAFGIMEHYFGDPSTGNLATATAMELPMLKAFKAYQKTWEGVYMDLLNFAITVNLAVLDGAAEYDEAKNRLVVRDGSDVDRTIDLDFPPILEKDIKNLAEGLSTAKREGLCPIETSRQSFLQGLGINNIEEELGKEFQEPAAQPFVGGDAQEVVRKSDGKWYVYSEDGKRLGGPYGTEAAAKKRLRQIEYFKHRESVTPKDFAGRRRPAVRLADKNRVVLARMNAYLKEIARVYNRFYREVVGSAEARVASGAEGGDKRWRLSVGVEAAVKALEDGMLKAGKRHLPEAVAVGDAYVRSRAGDGAVTEAVGEAFVDDQVEWNAAFVRGSLTPEARRKLLAAADELYESEAAALGAAKGAARAVEKQVGSYAAAFWTVEERAVKQAAREFGGQANFVGVEDEANCPGCAAAIEGNPWPVDDVPVPGEQDCLGNCRHAIQLVGDDGLAESDIEILRGAEERSRAGFRLLEEAAGLIQAGEAVRV